MHTEADLSDIWDNVAVGRFAHLSQIVKDDRVADVKQYLSFIEGDKAYAYERHSGGGAWKPVLEEPGKVI